MQYDALTEGKPNPECEEPASPASSLGAKEDCDAPRADFMLAGHLGVLAPEESGLTMANAADALAARASLDEAELPREVEDALASAVAGKKAAGAPVACEGVALDPSLLNEEQRLAYDEVITLSSMDIDGGRVGRQ